MKTFRIKRGILLVSLLLVVSFSIFAYADFELLFGGTRNDFGNCVQQTADTGFILFGSTTSFGTIKDNLYLVKTDIDGVVEPGWGNQADGSSIFKGIKSDIGNSVQQTVDGGYILLATTEVLGTLGPLTNRRDKKDMYLIKTDANGIKVWEKTYGGLRNDYGNSVQQTINDDETLGYILLGTTESFGPRKKNMYLVKTDENGLELWSKTFGGGKDDVGNSVQQTTDGGYILLGSTKSFGTGNYDMYLVKTDANGNLDPAWGNRGDGTSTFSPFGSSYTIEVGNEVIQTADGGYILVGTTSNTEGGSNDVYLVKVDANGIGEWDSQFDNNNGHDAGYGVKQTSDGGYIIVGETVDAVVDSPPNMIFVAPPPEEDLRTRDLWMLKVDENGAGEWDNTYGGATTDFGRSIQILADGGYVMLGSSNSMFLEPGIKAGNDKVNKINLGNDATNDPFDMYLVKVDASFQDADGDGFGNPEAPAAPGTGVADNTDCDDTDNAIFPDAAEACDGQDNDCDGDIDEGGVCEL